VTGDRGDAGHGRMFELVFIVRTRAPLPKLLPSTAQSYRSCVYVVYFHIVITMNGLPGMQVFF
jgi:hypothetical protein